MSDSVKNIILIDDDQISNFISERVIHSVLPDAKVLVFENGSTAYSYFISPDLLPPDLVFIDLNMPKMDGFELLDKLQPDKIRGLKIVILTTSVRQKDRDKSERYPQVIYFCEKHLSERKFSDILNRIDRFF